MEPRPTSVYRVPWQAARQEGPRRSLGRPQARPAPGPERTAADTPDIRWAFARRGPRHIPVVGPTEALSGRAGAAGRSGVAGRPGVTGRSGADAADEAPGPGSRPPGPVPGQQRGRERESGWQLAQRAWQESGVDWEDDPAQPEDTASGPYPPGPYPPGPYSVDPYAVAAYSAPFAGDRYPDDQYPDDPYPDDPHPDDSRPDDPYPGDPRPADVHSALSAADRYRADQYPDDSYPDDSYQDDPRAAGPRPGENPRPAGAYSAPFAADRHPDDPHLDDPYPDDPYPGDTAAHRGDAYWDDPRAADPRPGDAYPGEDPRPAGSHPGGSGPEEDSQPDDAYPADSRHRDEPSPPGAGGDLTDPHPTRPDLPALRGPGDTRHGRGPWPVQRPSGADHEGHGAGTRRAGSQPPPLPRRVRGTVTAVPPAAFAPASPFAPSPAFAARASFGPAPAQDPAPAPARAPASPAPAPGRARERDRARAFASAPLSAPVAPVAPWPPGAAAAPSPAEPEELFRAWQGSVRRAAGRRTPWPARRAPGAAARQGLGWQVAKIGVPAAVIVTVGAGALMMLTGRANEMLAERASAGAPSPGQASGKTAAHGPAGAGAAGPTLAGYPGQHGSVGVAALWSAGGITMAVGYADARPAVWRHATDGSWSLVSTAALGGVSGHLTAVADGPAGWIAVGSVNDNGTAEPALFSSPDGVNWAPRPALPGLAGSGAQFLGVAAGPGGYLVVGRQGTGSQAYASLWWSADLKNWTNGGSSGYHDSFAAAAVAVGGGFVAVGSQADCHTVWTSPDGQHWTVHDITRPAGAHTATLRSVAADAGGRFVAAGWAANGAGDLPVVVTSADGGAQLTQVVLDAPQGPAYVTAVTATGNGFVAVGQAGQAGARHAVEWTSADGLTWSAAAPVTAAGGGEITALTDSGTAVTGTAQRAAGPAVLSVPAR